MGYDVITCLHHDWNFAKLVFALYILVTALSPISGFSQFIETAQIPSLNMEENSFDTQQEILNITQQTLETEIEQELYSNGIQARATVILSANKQDVTIEKVEIYTSANESEVRSCLLTYFETEVEVDVYSTWKDFESNGYF
mgnify:CR=1 FL=1